MIAIMIKIVINNCKHRIIFFLYSPDLRISNEVYLSDEICRVPWFFMPDLKYHSASKGISNKRVREKGDSNSI